MTTVLDVAGALLLAALAFFVWPPAALGVLGVACLAASYAAQRKPALESRRERRQRK